MISDLNLILFGSFPIAFKSGSMSIQQHVNQRSTMDFQREDDGGDVWSIGQSIDAYEFGIKRFGGLVNEADVSVHEATDKKLWSIKCVDWGILADRRAMVDVDGNGTVRSKRQWDNTAVADIVSAIGGDYLTADGVDVTSFIFADPALVATTFSTDCSTVTQALNELAKLATSLAGIPYIWYIDFDKALHFEPWTQSVSDIVLSVDNNNCRGGSIKMATTGEQFTTRIIDKVAAVLTSPITETFDSGSSQPLDGSIAVWDMQSDVAATPAILLDNVTQSVGLLNFDTGMQFYWQQGSKTITAATAPNSGSTLSITYSAAESVVIIVEDADGIAARQAAEGMTGLYDMVIDSSTTPTTRQDAVQQCRAELARRAGESVIVTLETQESELYIGQQVQFDIPLYDTDLYLIRSMRIFDEGGTFVWRALELVKGPIVMDAIEYFRALLGTASGTASATSGAGLGFREYTFNIFDSTVGDDVVLHIPVAEPGVLEEIKGCFTMSGTADFVFRVKQNQQELFTFTIPANTGAFQTITSRTVVANQMVENLVLSGDVVASDGSCTACVVLKIRQAAQAPNSGLVFTGSATSGNFTLI